MYPNLRPSSLARVSIFIHAAATTIINCVEERKEEKTKLQFTAKVILFKERCL
jgi:hypothetical protein